MTNKIVHKDDLGFCIDDINLYREFSLFISNLSDLYYKELKRLRDENVQLKNMLDEKRLYVRIVLKVLFVFGKLFEFLRMKELVKKTTLYQKLHSKTENSQKNKHSHADGYVNENYSY
jgi:hypothetical protein